MELLSWMGRVYARFMGIAVALVSASLLSTNIAEQRFETLVWIWVLTSGFVGIVGGILYLLSWDGPKRFRTRKHRITGWILMLAAVILPSSLTLMTVPMVVILAPGLFNWPWSGIADQKITSE